MIWKFLIALGIFLIAIVGMAIGVIVSNRRIKGSCGGLSTMRDSADRPMCEMCTNPSPDCTGDPQEEDCPPECLSDDGEVSEERPASRSNKAELV